MRKIISLILSIALLLHLFSCGYILHPERRGQQSGHVDWAIVGLDAIGLIFFIIPGLIAFAVDIGSGTIYLSKNTPGFTDANWNDIQTIKIDPKNISSQTIAAAIKEQRGIVVDFNNPELQVYSDKELTQLSSYNGGL